MGIFAISCNIHIVSYTSLGSNFLSIQYLLNSIPFCFSSCCFHHVLCSPLHTSLRLLLILFVLSFSAMRMSNWACYGAAAASANALWRSADDEAFKTQDMVEWSDRLDGSLEVSNCLSCWEWKSFFSLADASRIFDLIPSPYFDSSINYSFTPFILSCISFVSECSVHQCVLKFLSARCPWTYWTCIASINSWHSFNTFVK